MIVYYSFYTFFLKFISNMKTVITNKYMYNPSTCPHVFILTLNFSVIPRTFNHGNSGFTFFCYELKTKDLHGIHWWVHMLPDHLVVTPYQTEIYIHHILLYIQIHYIFFSLNNFCKAAKTIPQDFFMLYFYCHK